MMKFSKMFPSKYLQQGDVEPPIVVVIKSVTLESIGFGDAAAMKHILHFQDGVKSMVLNPTNGNTLKRLYGDESDDWTGKPIEVWYNPDVEMKGSIVGGIRLRAPQSGSAAPHKTTPAILLWGQALELAAQAGMSEDDLKAAINLLGMVEYKPSRDGEIVRRLLSVRFAQKLEADKAAGQEGAGFTADDVDGTIPF